MELNRKNKIKFNDITILWLKSKKNIKVQSYQKYENIINNYIKDSIGNIPINTLTKDNIIDFFNNIKENEIALSTQKTLLYIVKASLEYAYNNNYSNYIDLKDIKLKTLPKTIYVFSKEQQHYIKDHNKDTY